uniref:Uncharacterized protein n=1 Tax=Pelusios castaneus TaxID=367368 RepID=A0A8C8RJU7_9SAUR
GWAAIGRGQLWGSRPLLPPTSEPTLSPQVRSPTYARCAAKPSARAPTSSPTAASTRGTSPSSAPCAPKASSARWTYGATRRLMGSSTAPEVARSPVSRDSFSAPCNPLPPAEN